VKIGVYSPNDFSSLFTKYIDGHEWHVNSVPKNVDMIYCASSSQLQKVFGSGREPGVPVVCWCWDIPVNWESWCRNDSELAEHSWRRESVRSTISYLKKCDIVLSASKFTQRTLLDNGIESKQLYFYVDVDPGLSVKKKDQVIQVSRFALNKRFDLTLQAYQSNKNVYEGYDLRFVGIGSTDYLKSVSGKRNGITYVSINPSRDHVLREIAASSLLVSPSVFEGWGITPIEALSLGVPVLLSDLEVFREVYGDIVLYHKKDDIGDYAEKMDFALHSYDYRRDVVRQAKPILAEFTPEKFAKRFSFAIGLR